MDERTPFNRRMREAREGADLTLTDVIVAMRADLPKTMWSSQTTLQRLETETTEEKAEPMMVAYLAFLYGRKTSELSAVAAADLDRVRDLVAGNAWPGIPV